jgi:hypothetical protein
VNSRSTIKLGLRLLGTGLFLAFLVYLIFFARPYQYRFSSAHKAEIQRIADRLCAAARAPECAVTWGGKNRWFGYLEPVQGSSLIGLTSLREVLADPEWSEEDVSNGVMFTGSAYEVFYSLPSGRIVITNRQETP